MCKFVIFVKYVGGRRRKPPKKFKTRRRGQNKPSHKKAVTWLNSIHMQGPKELIQKAADLVFYDLGVRIAQRVVDVSTLTPEQLKRLGAVGVYGWIVHHGDNAFLVKGLIHHFDLVFFGQLKQFTITSADVINCLGLAKTKYYPSLTLRMVAKEKAQVLNRLALHFQFEPTFYSKLVNLHFEYMCANRLVLSPQEIALCFAFNTNNYWIRQHYPKLYKLLQFDYICFLNKKQK